MKFLRSILAAALLVLSPHAHAQSGPGNLAPWNVVGNPSGYTVPSPGTPASMNAMLVGAFSCATNPSMLVFTTVFACASPLPAGLFPALTGDVTTTAGSLATTIPANQVSFAKFAQGGANTTLCNSTGGTANFQACTPGQMSANLCAPNVQIFTTGTAATYTVPTCNSVLASYLEIEMVGPGGPGAGSGTGGAAGTAGSASTFVFNSVTYTANPGAAGASGSASAGGTGGSATGCDDNLTGGTGANAVTSAIIANFGSIGGASFYGVSPPGTNGSAAPNAVAPGSGGGSAGQSTAQFGASAGGGGGFCRKLILVAGVTTGTYTIGAATTGGAGAGNGFNGGGGAAGRLRVVARWQ